MSRKPYLPWEEAFIRQHYADSATADLARALDRTCLSVYHKARSLGIRKSAAYIASIYPDPKHGEATRFQAGHTTWNKGMKGLHIGGEATQFKPGHRGGKALHLYQPIGAEVWRGDGYLWRKVRDDGPMHRRWEMVHRLIWIEHHGAIATGHAVVFRDGDRHHLHPDNLELITRRQLQERNSIHRYPPELRKTMKLVARLRRTLNDHEKQ